MIRFIHLADVHLGAVPDRGCPWSEKREEEIWETFRRVIASIRKDPVDLLFIAGDLFHRQPLLRELREVNYLFSTIGQTRIYLMAGNHDYMKEDSFYRSFEWGENVCFFKDQTPVCVRDEASGRENRVFVYGMSYHFQQIARPIYDSLQPVQQKGFHVLLAHGGDETHIPMDFQKIASAGFHYVALGHIHKPQILFADKMAYAGALEPLDRNDPGEHGYIRGMYHNGQVKIEFVPFACRSYQRILLEIKEDSTQYSLEEQLQAIIRQQGEEHLYRVVLRGQRSPDLLLLTEKLKKLGNIADILDESQPAYDLEKLKKRYSGTLIGEYISYFQNRDCSIEEKKALYYGLQALLQTSRQ